MSSYLLNCKMCGGSIEASDADIRKSIVQCSYCSTFFHVNENGIEATEEALENHAVPANVHITESDEKLTIRLPRTMAVIDLKSLKRYGILFAASFIISTILIKSAVISFFAMLALFILLIILSKKFFPLTDDIFLENGILSTSKKQMPVNEIKQIYCSSNNILGTDFANIFVLLKSGKREELTQYVSEAERALYVEEYLEVKLEIMNINVYGSHAVAVNEEGLSGEKEYFNETQCDSCGAVNNVSQEQWRKGILTCQYCESLSLIYDPTTQQPTLGLPDIKSLALIKVDHSSAATVFKVNGNESFRLVDDCLVAGAVGLKFRDVKTFRVIEHKKKIIGHASKDRPDYRDLFSFIADAREKMKYSQDVGINKSNYDLMAVTFKGEELRLLNGISSYIEVHAVKNFLSQTDLISETEENSLLGVQSG